MRCWKLRSHSIVSALSSVSDDLNANSSNQTPPPVGVSSVQNSHAFPGLSVGPLGDGEPFIGCVGAGRRGCEVSKERSTAFIWAY